VAPDKNPYSDPGPKCSAVEARSLTRAVTWLSENMASCLAAIFGIGSAVLWVLLVIKGGPAPFAVVTAVVVFAGGLTIHATMPPVPDNKAVVRALAVLLWGYAVILALTSTAVAVFGG
jgi:hypothetical protein